MAASAVALCYWVVHPVWQIHDDAYYAMLADGQGMVDRPVASLPYMHPLVGQILDLFRRLGLFPSYALFLIGLVLLATGVVGHRLAAARIGPFVWLWVAAAWIPIGLSLQYTAVCGMLVAAASVQILRPGGAVPSAGHWAVAGLLTWLACLLRVEMVAMAVVCVAVPIAVVARQGGASFRAWALGSTLTAGAVAAVHLVAGLAAADNRLSEFHRLNDPMAILMNYGYIEALRAFDSPLPAGHSRNDLALLSRWFFADLAMMQPEKMRALIDSVPAENLLRARYWNLLGQARQLHLAAWFWLLLGAVCLTLASKRRAAVLAGAAVLLLLAIAVAWLLKPLPERVAVGMALGLILIAALNFESGASAMRGQLERGLGVLALVLLLPIALLAVRDRMELADAARQWERDRALLDRGFQVYAFPGLLPLRAIMPPLGGAASVPRMVLLGSMYFTPEVLDAELGNACGGFLSCLGSGRQLLVVANDKDIELLSGLIADRHSKQLRVHETIVTPGFKAFVLSATSRSDPPPSARRAHPGATADPATE